jgi:hypothetical protein
MAGADIHLRLYPTSILDIYKLFEVLILYHKHMGAPLFHSTDQVGQDFGVLDHLWSGNDAIAL